MIVGVVDEASTRELRRRVLRPQLAPDEPLPGDSLTGGAHIGARDGDEVVGTCFVYPENCPWLPDAVGAWRLRQMATAPDRRGEGIGAAVLAGAAEYARTQLAPVLWCNARDSAIGFYERHGFRKHGEIFEETDPPIPHLHMWLELREPDAPPTSSRR